MKKLFFTFIFLSLSFCAFAAENIVSFDVILNLNKNGTATVTEEITVNAEHNKIKRGIYREIPQNPNQKIHVQNLEMNGIKHPYFTENNGDNLIINFGNDDYIPLGLHTYKLTYTMDNAVLFQDDYDEIYWNVTGNYWQFPIEKASFRLKLPEGAEVITEGISLYTGSYGQRARQAQSAGELYFKTTAPLPNYSGFTVAVPFKKGAVEMSLHYKLMHFIKHKLPILLTAILMLYYLITWYKYGKDPRSDKRVLFAPPEDISPALARYILKRRYDLELFSAALVSLSIKNKIKIKSDKKKIELERLDADNAALPEEEKHILNKLFQYSEKQLIGNKYERKLEILSNNIKRIIEEEGKHYINKNYKFAILPAIIMLIMQIAMPEPMPFINIFLMIIVISFALSAKPPKQLILYIIIISLMSSTMLLDFKNPAEIYFIISLLAFYVYMNFIDNTTKQGRETYLNVLGFKRYMENAELLRAQESDPEDKLKIFADFLPYAYTFGIQSKWIKNFTQILSEDIINERLEHMGGRNIFISYALASSFAKAATPPSSNGAGGGGSFGGGFSGGGFGGGGGGGR